LFFTHPQTLKEKLLFAAPNGAILSLTMGATHGSNSSASRAPKGYYLPCLFSLEVSPFQGSISIDRLSMGYEQVLTRG